MAKQNPNLDMSKISQEQMIMMAGAIREAKTATCGNCGGEIFNQGTRLKILSKLLTGGERDEPIGIPAVYCIKCHTELNLDEEKPKDSNEIVLDFKR